MGDNIMATTINADTSEGLKLTSDTSGELELQSNGVTQAKITANGLQDNNGNSLRGGSFRNLIINGNMQVAQRGTSATGKTTSGYYTCDRWNNVFSEAGTWTFEQDTDVPSGQGFSKSLKYDCTTANTSLGASASLQLHHRLEGQMLQHLKKGTSSAEKLTLSFWVKSNKTGTFVVNLQDIDNTRMIGYAYTIDTADTWEKKTVTFDGDTTGALDNDNAQSMRIAFWFASGSNYNSGTTPTSWEAKDDTDQAGDLSVNLADSTSNYINITGVQLEVGEGASDFEFLPYDVQLARCQRYCYEIAAKGRANQVIGTGFMYDTTRARIFITFPVTMRTYPSVTSTNISNSIEFNVNSDSKYVNSLTLPFGTANNTSGIMIQGTFTSGTATAGQTRYVRFTDGNVQLIFSAEL